MGWRERKGSGDPILFLHGSGRSRLRYWNHSISYTPDCRGLSGGHDNEWRQVIQADLAAGTMAVALYSPAVADWQDKPG